jgi:hypothetical protein
MGSGKARAELVPALLSIVQVAHSSRITLLIFVPEMICGKARAELVPALLPIVQVTPVLVTATPSGHLTPAIQNRSNFFLQII